MELRRISTFVFVLAGAAALSGSGCGSYGGSPTTPTPTPAPGGSGATVTITAGGISPSTVTISAGQQVTFVNNSQVEMAVTSDPHPTHTDCPPINSVGTLLPGQTRATGGFSTARSCGFHDHDHPDDASRRGTITIQ